MLMHRTRSITLMIMAACALGSMARAAPMPRLTPDDVAGINRKMRALVDSSQAAGVVTLIVQDDKRVDLDACGSADTSAHKPMRADSIGAVASMTKPITGVAMMMLMLMLYEQGS